MKNRPKPEARRRGAKTSRQLELVYRAGAVEECLLRMRTTAAFLDNEKLRVSSYSNLGTSINAVLDSLDSQQNEAKGSEKEMWAAAHLQLARCVESITDILKQDTVMDIRDLAKLLKKLNKQIDRSLKFIFDILNARQAAEGD